MAWFGRNPDGSPITFRQEIAHVMGAAGPAISGWGSQEDSHLNLPAGADLSGEQGLAGVIGPGSTPDTVTLAMPGGLQMEAPVNPGPDVIDVLNTLHGSDIRDHPGFAPMFQDGPAAAMAGDGHLYGDQSGGGASAVNPAFDFSQRRPDPFGGTHDDASAWQAQGRDILRSAFEPGLEISASSPTPSTYTVARGDALEPIARAHYGDNWRAGIVAMMRANHLRRNADGSPLIYANQVLQMPELDGDLRQLNRAGGALVAQNTIGLEAARQRAANYAHASADRMFGGATGSWSETGAPSAASGLEYDRMFGGASGNWSEPSPHSAGNLLDHSRLAKAVGGEAAFEAGLLAGGVHSLWDTATGLYDAGKFVVSLTDPNKAAAAWNGAVNAVRGAASYVENGVQHPGDVLNDIRSAAHQANVDYNPLGTPMNETFIGELRRKFGIGHNDGRLAGNVAQAVAGLELVKGADVVGLAGRLGDPLAKGADAATIAAFGRDAPRGVYLQKAYDGVGHHFFPERWSKPLNLPASVRNSSLNVLKPNGLTQEEFYKLHYFVDPQSRINRLPNRFGGAWNGKRLGIQRGNLADRLWYGSPQPLKTTIGAPIILGTGSSVAGQMGQ